MPISAYFIFCEGLRAEEKARLDAERSEECPKITAADVAKSLGQKWKSMSEEEKQKYRDLAQERAEQKEAEDAADEADNGANKDEGAKKKLPSPTDGLLPLSVVKRIILCDEETSRISAEGLAVVAAAANEFLGLLAQKGAQAAISHKRRTVKLDDLEKIIKTDRKLHSMGLKDVIAAVKHQVELQRSLAAAKQGPETAEEDTEAHEDAENRSPGDENKEACGRGGAAAAKRGRPGKKQKAEIVAPQNKISAFFTPAVVN